MKQPFTELSKLLFFNFARQLLPKIPLTVLYKIGDQLGNIMRGDKDKVITEQLRQLFDQLDDKTLKSIVTQATINFRKDLMEIWSFPYLTKTKIEQMCHLEGLEHLDRALDRGRGAIICLAHFGSWKIILPALGYQGYKLNQIAANPMVFVKPEESTSHNSIMRYELTCEQSLPVKFIYVENRQPPRELYRALKNNEIVVVALDGVIGTNRMQVPFLNGEIALSSGPVKLAQRTGAVLLPHFSIRERDNKHQVIICEPLAIKAEKADFQYRWLCAFAQLFAQKVQSHPDHYARFLYTLKKYPVPSVGNLIRPKRTEKT